MRRRDRQVLGVLSAVVVVGALLAGAFFFGSHNPAVTVEDGSAHVGDGVATAFVDGWAYGIPMDGPWSGTDGVWREDGTPACMAWTGTPRNVNIEFGWVPITWPDAGGQGVRQVVWVSCTG